MGFNTNIFRKNLGSLISPAHFEVRIEGPDTVEIRVEADGSVTNVANHKFTSDVRFWATSAEIPGVNFVTQDTQAIYGPISKVPYLRSYNDMTITFLETRTNELRRKFAYWQYKIGHIPQLQDAENTSNVRSGTENDFDFDFQDNYKARTMEIVNFDHAGKKVYRILLNDAWPISVGNISLDWGSKDTPMTFPVTFAYRYYNLSYFK